MFLSTNTGRRLWRVTIGAGFDTECISACFIEETDRDRIRMDACTVKASFVIYPVLIVTDATSSAGDLPPARISFFNPRVGGSSPSRRTKFTRRVIQN